MGNRQQGQRRSGILRFGQGGYRVFRRGAGAWLAARLGQWLSWRQPRQYGDEHERVMDFR